MVYAIRMRIAQPVLFVAGLLPLRLVHVLPHLLPHRLLLHHLRIYQERQIVQILAQMCAHLAYVKNLVQLILFSAVQTMQPRILNIAQILEKVIHV